MISKVTAIKPCARFGRAMSTLVATEEFPFKTVLTPKAATAPVVTEEVLANGVKLKSRAAPDTAGVHLKFTVHGGSRAETLAEQGAAQFSSAIAFHGFEHACGQYINDVLGRAGVQYWSTVDREAVHYNLRLLSGNEESLIRIVYSLLEARQPTYVLDELRSDVAVFYENHQHDHAARFTDLIHEVAYGEGSPLGRSLFAKNVTDLSAESILSYQNRVLRLENVTLHATGLPHKQIRDLAAVKGTQRAQEVNALAPSPYVGGEFKVRQDIDGDESHVGLAFPVPAGANAKSFEVLKNLLCERISAKGLCAHTSTFHHQYSSGGLFGIHAVGSADAASKNLQAVVEELKNIAGSSNVNVATAKKRVALANALKAEGPLSTVSLSNPTLFGLAGEVDLQYVTSGSVSSAAAEALKSVPSYAVYGTTLGTPSLAAVSKWLK